MKKLFMTFAAMLLVSVGVFAQSAPTYYWYVGTTKPTSLSQATIVNEYESEYTYTNNSGAKSHIFVLTNSNKTVTFIEPNFNAPIDQKEIDTTTIPGYKIYETAVGCATGGPIIIRVSDAETTYYWYVGTTKPTSLSQATIVDSYESEYIYTNNSGAKSHIFVLTNPDKTVTFINRQLNAPISQLDVDITTIPGYKIFETGVGTANTGSIIIRVSDASTTELFSNNKLYTLNCKRGGLVLNADATGLAAGQTRTDAPESDKCFAIITYNDSQYLYSPVNKQYLSYDGSFVSRLGSPITFDDSQADGEYKFMLSTQNESGETWYFNNNGNIVINDWSYADDGNRWLIEPVADFDPTEALAMAAAQICKVTYQVKYESKVVATATVEVAKGSALPAVPASLNNSFVTLTKSGTHPTTVTKDVTVNFTATWNGPFKFTKTLSDATWYYMHIRSGWYVSKQDTEPYYPAQVGETERLEPAYVWAFGGDPYHVKVYNFTTGLDETLTKDGENAVMRKSDYTWDLLPNSDGFVLRVTGTENSCINQYGGGGGPLKFWTDNNSLTDDGSTFRVEDITSLIDGIETIHNSQFFIHDEGDTLFDLFGRKLAEPQKGINIIRYSDGTSKKVLVK